MNMAIRRATGADLDQIVSLLRANGLPADDITLRHLDSFRVMGESDGVVGLEFAGEAALLRSLVVRHDARSRGIGDALVRDAEAEAATHGATSLWLLTTTAASFFARRGYSRAARDDAPEGIQATAEFREACPSSAVCMTKVLRA